jgi:hypothetical protein
VSIRENGVTKAIRTVLLLVALWATSQGAFASAAGCPSGYQDNTCLSRLVFGAETPQQCPTSPGYTTVSPAQWIGSQYSAPQCNYEAPPSCPPGYVQGGPNWNGSSWVDLSCIPQAPAIPTIVASAGFYVWETCESMTNGNQSGTMPVLVYKATWSNGSTSYYQYWLSKTWEVLQDSSGNYYLTSFGDVWGPTTAGLFIGGADPSFPPPAQPVYACSGTNNH